MCSVYYCPHQINTSRVKLCLPSGWLFTWVRLLCVFGEIWAFSSSHHDQYTMCHAPHFLEKSQSCPLLLLYWLKNTPLMLKFSKESFKTLFRDPTLKGYAQNSIFRKSEILKLFKFFWYIALISINLILAKQRTDLFSSRINWTSQKT